MLGRILRWREDRGVARLARTLDWEAAVADWPPLARFQGAARIHLRELALRFLLRKQFVAGADFVVTDAMRLRVATMAVLPVYGLGLDWYRGWHSIVLYESAFVPEGDWEDEFGIVHSDREALSGEAWPQGGVLLSWEDVTAADDDAGYNVVIHEMAHKLDMLAEGPNGAPPLHRDMDPARWRNAFLAAWDALEAADARGEDGPLDAYALTDTGEFFAVASECFFEAPDRLAAAWPDVFEQLQAFYRQDPRLPAAVNAGQTGSKAP